MTKRILIALDLEGVNNVAGEPYSGLYKGSEGWETARRQAALEVNAAACALFASGVIALIGKNMIPAVIVLFVGCGVGIGFLCAVQIKYNRKK